MTFRGFVILGAMRTGSNLLEETLSTAGGITCHGEVFNPHFVGGPRREAVLGVDKKRRDADPVALLEQVFASGGLNGFRYFADHDPRVLDAVLRDKSIAKVILTRNPVDSYVSWKIAQKTGQWKLTRVDRRKSATIRFDPAEYRAFDGARRDFHTWLRSALMVRG